MAIVHLNVPIPEELRDQLRELRPRLGMRSDAAVVRDLIEREVSRLGLGQPPAKKLRASRHNAISGEAAPPAPR